jgi:hypothetical protein
MFVKRSNWNGVTASIFVMEMGEKILPERHQHTFDHTTMVVKGMTSVIIWHPDAPATSVLVSKDCQMTLPANVDHTIEALEDNTIVINMDGKGDSSGVRTPRNPSQHSGVLMADGTVVHAA